MKRTQTKVVYTTFLQWNKLLHHVNYLSSIKNTFYGGSVYHDSKISGNYLNVIRVREFIYREG
jgi:hypothetical protein